MSLRPRGAPALLLPILVCGLSCASYEPESAYQEIPEQAYSFATAWECLLEAVQAEGFEVGHTERDGDNGHFTTRFKVIRTDPSTRAQESRRIAVRIRPAAQDSYYVHVAASLFRRPDPASDWSFQQKDAALLARLEATLHQRLGMRYRKNESSR